MIPSVSSDLLSQDTAASLPIRQHPGHLPRLFARWWQHCHSVVLRLGAKQGLRIRANQRRLRVSETVSLGEKRFVSIVEVDGRSYLIGGAASSVALLTQLPGKQDTESFGAVLGSMHPHGETA